MTVECVGRANPQAGDGLVIVVERLLRLRRSGHEEAGVEPAAFTDRGDPVAHVVDVVGREAKPLGGAQLHQAQRPTVDGVAVGQVTPFDSRIVEADDVAVAPARQQHAGLLEALPDGRDPEAQTALAHCE